MRNRAAARASWIWKKRKKEIEESLSSNSPVTPPVSTPEAPFGADSKGPCRLHLHQPSLVPIPRTSCAHPASLTNGYAEHLNLPPYSGAFIDLSSLIILEGKICWDLYIDGLVVSSDGNLLDALAAAIKAALSNAGIPKVSVIFEASLDDQPEVNLSDEEFLQFDTSGVPVVVTLTKVGRHYIVDATSEEESQMSSAVSVSVNRRGRVCGLTKRGSAGLDPSLILDMISVAKHVSENLIAVYDSEIAAAEASEADGS